MEAGYLKQISEPNEWFKNEKKKTQKKSFEINWIQKLHHTALNTNVEVKGKSFYGLEST